MNSAEIYAIVNSVPLLADHFLGVCAANELPKTIKTVPSFLVVNTDYSGNKGKHWICFFFSSLDSVHYFDSYALAPELYHKEWRAYLFSHARELHRNRVRVQDYLSNVCGEHALLFAYHRLRGISYPEILETVYSPTNQCYNDRLSVLFLNKIAKTKLQLKLKQPVVLCAQYMYQALL